MASTRCHTTVTPSTWPSESLSVSCGSRGGFATRSFDTGLQEDLKDGILKFNLKPKLGLASLHNKGQLDQNDPKAVAQFLLQNAERLDKTVVGDYLGKEETYQDGFCVKVLHSYGEQMDFSGACQCPLLASRTRGRTATPSIA